LPAGLAAALLAPDFSVARAPVRLFEAPFVAEPPLADSPAAACSADEPSRADRASAAAWSADDPAELDLLEALDLLLAASSADLPGLECDCCGAVEEV
jgi:hypothetical protein